MVLRIGPRRQHLLTAWGEVVRSNLTGRGYDLTTPTRSERFRDRLAAFVSNPTEETFDELWTPDAIAAAEEWFCKTIRSIWPNSLDELASFLDEIRHSDTYNTGWETRVSWGDGVIHEVYSRTHPDEPIVSTEARRGLKKFGIEAEYGYGKCRSQIVSFRDLYERYSGHVTADYEETIPVFEEIDQLFRLVMSADPETIQAEAAGPRGKLYKSLRGYPGPNSGDGGPIDIDFEAATPAIDGHLAAREAHAYKDTETTHWAGSHYEWWKWDFAEYVTTEVATEYDVTNLKSKQLDAFLTAFWTNADEYTDTEMLSTPVPQYLLGSWGVRQFADLEQHFLDHPEEAAAVLSDLFDEDQHLVDRLERFHAFGQEPEISDGNLLRVATTFLMGVYPDQYVNFQYERFDTFFSECTSSGSLETGYDARQYYRIVLSCRDIRDALRKECPDANMLDVHTLIRLYQDFVE